MPPLRLCGYPIFFADDDSYIFSITTLLLTLVQVGFLLIPGFVYIRQATNTIQQYHDTYSYQGDVHRHDTIDRSLLSEMDRVMKLFHIFWSISFTTSILAILLEIAM
jgi:hypothetical protein